MNLFFNPASPFVRKVLVAAHECNLVDRITLEPLALTPVSPSTNLNGENPLGKIPALVLDDGNTLFDSRVICEYLNELGQGTLFPKGDKRWQALRLQSIADGICDAGVLVRYETFVRPPAQQWDKWVDNQKQKFRRALHTLEQEVNNFTDLVDIGSLSVVIALDYIDFRYADENWRDNYPQLAAWHSEISSRPSLQHTLPKDLVT